MIVGANEFGLNLFNSHLFSKVFFLVKVTLLYLKFKTDLRIESLKIYAFDRFLSRHKFLTYLFCDLKKTVKYEFPSTRQSGVNDANTIFLFCFLTEPVWNNFVGSQTMLFIVWDNFALCCKQVEDVRCLFDRGSVDRISLDRNCVFSLDRNLLITWSNFLTLFTWSNYSIKCQKRTYGFWHLIESLKSLKYHY